MEVRTVIHSLIYTSVLTMVSVLREAILFVNGIPFGQVFDASFASADEIIVTGLKSLELFNPLEDDAESFSSEASESTSPTATTSQHNPTKTWTRDPFLASTPAIAIGGAPFDTLHDYAVDLSGPEDFALLISRAKAEFVASLPPSALRQWIHWQKRGVQQSFFRRGEEHEERGSSVFFPVARIQTQGTNEDKTTSSKKIKRPMSRKYTDGPGTHIPHGDKAASSSSLSSASQQPVKTINTSYHEESLNTGAANLVMPSSTSGGDPMALVPAHSVELGNVIVAEGSPPKSLHRIAERRRKTGDEPSKDGSNRKTLVFRGRGGRESGQTHDSAAGPR
ncbi:hypothetical protein TGPRC2_248820 [Toxoplasma gondii TgCatPRC2]|uniref:Uncharacterized protein n=1 Tax=Toxoplasma gondii TgCatPRC2 TaxID=1130821 RepID=A0A151HFR1_TOXGO|nr:hypothetical protein TGPRC2_248820 [Toxoplasma gondii TgCatPRC2]